jgi:hypothetical protein
MMINVDGFYSSSSECLFLSVEVIDKVSSSSVRRGMDMLSRKRNNGTTRKAYVFGLFRFSSISSHLSTTVETVTQL